MFIFAKEIISMSNISKKQSGIILLAFFILVSISFTSCGNLDEIEIGEPQEVKIFKS